MANAPNIPAMRPRMPTADRILPYLRRIDASRWYSNHGPLVQELEERTAAHFGMDASQAACVASGTVGLQVAFMEERRDERDLCLLPSWTFAATAHAVALAGWTPFFIDVAEATWGLTPERVREALQGLDADRVGLVCPVSVFGGPVDLPAWDAFATETGIPVVVDAAAAFDSIEHLGRSTVVISLHCTKVLGSGEGGVVFTTEADRVASIRKRLNFDFNANRECDRLALNGKMSEYAAAAGLAALDVWPEQRDGYRQAKANYIEHFQPLLGSLQFRPDFTGDWISYRFLIQFTEPIAQKMQVLLKGRGIDTQRWWGNGCHLHPAFRRYPQEPEMPQTDWLGKTALGIPTFPDLTEEQVVRVAEAMADALSACHAGV